MILFAPKRKTGLPIQAAQVVLAPSRAVTSYLRKWFDHRYRRRGASGWLFAFDLALLAVAGLLVAANLFFVLRPFFSPLRGVELVLRAPPLTAARPVPIEAVIRATDGRTHPNVGLTWHLPSWVEIVSAEPPLTENNSVLLGEVSPAQDRRSRLRVLIRAPSDTDVPFAFKLQEGSPLSGNVFTGSESRPVVASALTATPAFSVDQVEPGGTIPIIVKNGSSLAAPAVILRLTGADGAARSRFDDGSDVHIGALGAEEERIAYLSVVPDPGVSRVELRWELQDESRTVQVFRIPLRISDSVGVHVVEPLRSTPGGATAISTVSDAPAGLWVAHPLQETGSASHARTYDLAAGTSRISIPIRPGARTTDSTWSVIPFIVRSGMTVVGKRTVGVLSTPFPFAAAGRYYAETGDQVGVGPLPPRVGETTSYWIVWSVGPTDADLRDLTIEAPLLNGVRATGKFASDVPGNFSSDDGRARWSVPSVSRSGDTPTTFAFEIEYAPTAAHRGKVVQLVGKSSATGIEARSGATLEAEAPSQDTNLQNDERANGRGTVE
ncbi:hypothetical protein HY479_00675 [Candidatus Uhrbacteria bacterium]|nr:hypothetical protein [Candidatus Uhrbacteria bacterium]